MAATAFCLLLIFGKLSAATEIKTTEIGKSQSLLERQVEKLILKYEALEETTLELVQKNAGLEREVERLKQDNELYKTYFAAKLSLSEPFLDSEMVSASNHDQKGRLLKRSDDLGAVEPVLGQVTQRVNEMSAELQALKQTSARHENTIGTTYIRWGHNACPNSSETVYSENQDDEISKMPALLLRLASYTYAAQRDDNSTKSGSAGGSLYSQSGAAANHLCLPPDPVFDNHPVPRYSAANLYGSEYNTCDEPECDTTPACAVCRIPRASSIMIAGTNKCSGGWTLEYSGYVMASRGDLQGATEYICVDSIHKYLPGTQGDTGGNLFYYTIFKCGSMPCPPYVDGKIVLCAVCSK